MGKIAPRLFLSKSLAHQNLVAIFPRMIVSPGQTITDGQGLLRGHGTYAESSSTALISSTLGSVERVARWVSVKPAKHRYIPEVGDIVVGRVKEIAAKRWLVDIGARQDASLPLSAVHLTGGDQRRRTLEDQLAMRGILAEGDLVGAEVHSVLSDGSVMLHARSMQYGKLDNGCLIKVPASLVPRQKQHVLSLPEPVACDVVFGVNGWVWLTGSLGLGDDAARSDGLAIEDELAEAIEARKKAAATTPATSKARAAIAALRRVLQYCAREGLSVALENCVLGASTLLAHPGRDADVLLHDTLM